MISSKYLHYVQAFLLSGFMSLFMSGVITYMNLGFISTFFAIWLHAWLMAFAVALPTILLVFPVARKLAMKIASK